METVEANICILRLLIYKLSDVAANERENVRRRLTEPTSQDRVEEGVSLQRTNTRSHCSAGKTFFFLR